MKIRGERHETLARQISFRPYLELTSLGAKYPLHQKDFDAVGMVYAIYM